MTDPEQFFRACLEALYFTDTGGEGQPSKDMDLDFDTLQYLSADCLSFWRRFGCYIKPAGHTPKQAGHDFWLTRNGHGSGFWDGDWPEPWASILDEGAKCYGPFETYLGDDGKIYSS